MPVIPPSSAGPPLPEARPIEPTEPVENAGKGERAILIVVAVMLFILFAAALILPHTPLAADW